MSEILAASIHPVLLYHIPEFGPPVPVPLVAELPVWGVKDSGGDLSYTRAVLAAGKQVMVGAEHTIVDAVQAGAAGSIPGLANVLPEHLVAVVAAARAGNTAAAGKILGQALAFRDEMLGALGPFEWMSAMKLLAQRAARGGPGRRPGSAAGRAGRRRQPARGAAGQPARRGRIR